MIGVVAPLLSTTALETTEDSLTVNWALPTGNFDGFNIQCVGENGALSRNVTAYRNGRSSSAFIFACWYILSILIIFQFHSLRSSESFV